MLKFLEKNHSQHFDHQCLHHLSSPIVTHIITKVSTYYGQLASSREILSNNLLELFIPYFTTV